MKRNAALEKYVRIFQWTAKIFFKNFYLASHLVLNWRAGCFTEEINAWSCYTLNNFFPTIREKKNNNVFKISRK